jgi:hypothetical protein
MVGPAVDPIAFVEPGTRDVIVGLAITVESLRRPAREICTFLMEAGLGRAVAAGKLERERPDVRDNVMSHMMPPSFFSEVSPAQRRAAYDAFQDRVRLRVSLLEMARRRSTICERRALTDSLIVTERVVGQ